MQKEFSPLLSYSLEKYNYSVLNLKQKILSDFFQYICLHIYIYIIKENKKNTKESSPFRNEETSQSFHFLTTTTTKKAEYANSTTNRQKQSWL